MATVYKIEVVSYWVNYSEEEIQEMIKKALKDVKGNDFEVEVERK